MKIFPHLMKRRLRIFNKYMYIDNYNVLKKNFNAFLQLRTTYLGVTDKVVVREASQNKFTGVLREKLVKL